MRSYADMVKAKPAPSPSSDPIPEPTTSPRPETPEPCPMVTLEQLHDIQGKFYCLQKLLKNPRATKLELKPYINAISFLFNTLLRLGIDNKQSVFETRIKMMMPLEHFLIRVIAGGEDVDKVRAQVFKKCESDV